MPKQSVSINFAEGLDRKTDPFQLNIGKFLALTNSVFKIGKRLTKRNGYQQLPVLPYPASYLTTFNSDLTAIGSKIQAYSSGSKSWVIKGNITPVKISTLPLIRNNLNQSQSDIAISSNGLICTVYTEQNNGSIAYKYAVADAATGQNIVAPTVITAAAPGFGTPRVFSLDNYFVILFLHQVVSTFHLQYIAISIANPSSVTPATDLAIGVSTIDGIPFDAAVLNNTLYFSFGYASGIKVAFLTGQLVVSASIIVDSTHGAMSYVSVTIDSTSSIIWTSYYAFATGFAYTFATNTQLAVVLAPTQLLSGAFLNKISSSAQNGVLTFYYENQNFYSYDSSISTNYVSTETCTIGGTVGSPKVLLRGVNIASKGFIYNGTNYIFVAYQSLYQNTYFLTDSSGNIIAKLAYGNGGTVIDSFVSSVPVNGNVASFSYLFKDLIQAVNKNTTVIASGGSQTAGIYSQTGINVGNFLLKTPIVSVETGENLNFTGGFLWAYDGFQATEQNFFLYPDSVEVDTSGPVSITGDVTSGQTGIANISSMVGVAVGAIVSGSSIPSVPPTTIVSVNVANNSAVMSNSATGTHISDPITVTGLVTAQQYFYQVTYEWSDNQGNLFRSAPSVPVTITTGGAGSINTIFVPTLRLTYKISNPVKIVVYRWSTAQQTYYQVTSITAPVLNDTTIDSVAIYDALSDSEILGNNIIYTNGGVIEDIGPPGFTSIFAFDDRLFGIDSEDPNLIWFSKQIIEATPVEMSDLLTIFIAPSISAQGPTGPLSCGAPMDDKAILFKTSALYYINGSGPDNTGSNSQYSQPIFITSMVGSTNQASIVFQPEGLMFEFASEAGNQIWLLGRDLSTRYIGDAVEDLTANATVLSSLAIPGTTEVRFRMSSGITLKYDYYYHQWGIHSTSAITNTLFQGLDTYISNQGSVFIETPGQYLDGTSPVLLGFTTGWLNVAGLRGYERIHEFTFLGTYISPHKLVVKVAYDYGSPQQQSIYTPTNFSPAYGEAPIYGDGVYGGPGNIEQFRVFTKHQKCRAFQITVQEIYDPSFGVVAGEGLNLSGINLIMTFKKAWAPTPGKNSIG